MLQIIISSKSNIIAVSFFEKTRTVIWNDTEWGTRLGSSKSTSPYMILFTSPFNLPGMPYRIKYSWYTGTVMLGGQNELFSEWCDIRDYVAKFNIG
jgi:hypothetical protein